MNKHKIFIPILIVIVIIILILSYSLLFGKKTSESQNAKIIEKVKQIFPPTVTVTPNPYSESGESLIEEFNTAERVEYTYTLSNGEIYTIAIPKGIDPPPLAVVEKMYRIEKGL